MHNPFDFDNLVKGWASSRWRRNARGQVSSSLSKFAADQHGEFDAWTKTVGTGISRRRMLKDLTRMLAGGLVILYTGRTAKVGGASQTDPNLVIGTCDDLESYIQGTGVTCSTGEELLGAVGCTAPQFTGSATYTYTSAEKGNKVCVTAQVTGVFAVTTQITKITWQPSPTPCDNCACQDELKEWQARIDAHEQHHVQDAQKVVMDTQTKWKKPRTYNACADTENEALDGINTMVQTDLNAEVENIRKKYRKLAVAYDTNNEILGPECAPCAPCGSTSALRESAQSTSTFCCPAGQEFCQQGLNGPFCCPPGWGCCTHYLSNGIEFGVCYDLMNDDNYCGTCDRNCGSFGCVTGVCCPPGSMKARCSLTMCCPITFDPAGYFSSCCNTVCCSSGWLCQDGICVFVGPSPF